MYIENLTLYESLGKCSKTVCKVEAEWQTEVERLGEVEGQSKQAVDPSDPNSTIFWKGQKFREKYLFWVSVFRTGTGGTVET